MTMRARRLFIPALVVFAAHGAWADGTLDPNFGNGGIVITGPNGSGVAKQAAIQPDGRIVAVGYGGNLASPTSATDVLLARYEANGTLDATFGTQGLVITHIPGPSGNEFGYDVALQPDGKIVVVGHKFEAHAEMLAVRYLTNGSLDPSFGVNGIVRLTPATESFANSIALQPDGRILLGGLTNGATGPSSISVVRLQPNGSLDSTFGTGGLATIDASGNGTGGTMFDLALQADGRIVVTGFVRPDPLLPEDTQLATARFTAAGLPDSTFGTNGVVRTNVGPQDDVGIALAIQPDGRVVVGGYTRVADQEALVVRYTTSGALDASFGTGGIASLSLGVQNQARALIVQPDAKIVTAGLRGPDFMLARFTSTGTLDASFGTNGTLVTSTSTGRDEANGIQIPSPNTLLAVGMHDDGRGFALARYAATTPVTLKRFAVE
jgi:uncharacterized delta-60 repeat protein